MRQCLLKWISGALFIYNQATVPDFPRAKVCLSIIQSFLQSSNTFQAPILYQLNPRSGFHGGLAVKNPPAMQEMWVGSLRWEGPLEKGMATHSNILAWRIPWTEEPGRLQSTGLQDSDTVEQLSHHHQVFLAVIIYPVLITVFCKLFKLKWILGYVYKRNASELLRCSYNVSDRSKLNTWIWN